MNVETIHSHSSYGKMHWIAGVKYPSTHRKRDRRKYFLEDDGELIGALDEHIT